MQYRVLKPLIAAGRFYDRGELLEADGWRTLPQLVSQRYLAPVITAAAESGSHGRRGAPVRREERNDAEPADAR